MNRGNPKQTSMKKVFSIICIVAGMLFCMSATLEAKIYLVSVGISKYERNPLRLPVSDAKTLKYVYDHNGDTKSVLIIDENATLENVLEKVRSFFAPASENDIVVLFFSGHGYQGGFCAYNGLLSYDAIREAMAVSKSKNKMIFADACYSGNMRQGKKANNNNQNTMKNANVMLFLSSRNTETSLESSLMDNGFFTYALQRALRGGADANRDRVITARELFNYVSKKVSTETGGRQHPVMWGKFSNNMPVIEWRKKGN